MNPDQTVTYLTKSEYIYETLKKQIITGDLKPNERLVLSRVAAQFNTSEVPVREAMKKLEVEGLVTIVPHVGTVVRELLASEVEELYTIRAVLEGLAIKLAIENMTAADLGQLEEILQAMQKAIDINDVAAYGLNDKSFHLTVASISKNERLYKMIESIWNETQQAQAIFRINPDQMLQSLLDHRELLKALEQRDCEKAEMIVKSHRLLTAEMILKYLARKNSGN